MVSSTNNQFRFADVSGPINDELDIWESVLIPRAAIEEQIEALSEGPTPDSGRRASTIIHPRSTAPGLGLAPGVDVTINVLMPGEETRPMRRNANGVEFCLSGEGIVECGGKVLNPRRWNVWNVPAMQVHRYRNEGRVPFVRLSYSNAPLLEKLGIHYVEYDPMPRLRDDGGPSKILQDTHTRASAPDFRINNSSAHLLGYESLVDIEVINNEALLWPWDEVSQALSSHKGDGKRNLLLLYNPATERRMGTTHTFFATLSRMPSAMAPPARGHKHGSVAINYHFEGSGESVVDGRLIEWSAGDLLLSAPAWSEHSHGVGPNGASALTVQDHPLHIAMESLIWQESMSGPILSLGAEEGVKGYTGPREPAQ